MLFEGKGGFAAGKELEEWKMMTWEGGNGI